MNLGRPFRSILQLRRRWKVTGALVALLGTWLVAVTLTLTSARSHASAAADLLDAWRADTKVSELLEGNVDAELIAATAELETAHARATSPVLWPAKIIPGLNRQVDSVQSMTGSARAIAATALEGQHDISAATSSFDETGDRLALLGEIQAISARMANELAAADLGPASGLIGPLPTLRAELADQLHDATDAADDAVLITNALANFLEGPTTYLLLGTNNAEMRAGSGMVLSIGKLEVADGEMSVAEFSDVDAVPLDEPFESGDPDLDANWGWLRPTGDWRNLAMSPRFGLTGRTAAAMWQAQTGERVDGVIAIDPVALSRLVEVTGSVRVGSEEFDSSGLLYFLLAGQYEQFDAQFYPAEGEDDLLFEHLGTPEFEAAVAARQGNLAALVRAVTTNVNAVGADLAPLADELLGFAGTRHVMMWSADPATQSAWRAAGLAGEIGADSLMVGLTNRGANKLDYFMELKVDVDVVTRGNDLDVTLTVHATNTTPDGRRKNQVGPNVDLEADPLGFGEYFGFLSVTLPSAVQQLRTGEGQIVANGPDGESHVIGMSARVPRGESESWQIFFSLPASESVVVLEPSARLVPTVFAGGGHEEGDDIQHEIDFADFIS